MVCYDIPSNCTSSVDILKKTWSIGSHISMKKMMNKKYMRSVKVDLVCLCNEPLPRAGLFISSARLLARPSLFVDSLVLAAGFPLLSVSRFNDGIAITKQQQWISSSSFFGGKIPLARSMSAAPLGSFLPLHENNKFISMFRTKSRSNLPYTQFLSVLLLLDLCISVRILELKYLEMCPCNHEVSSQCRKVMVVL
ncbi:hypothetical protein T4E_6526 [Trichinella pseudospiralis]|uniref:Uncharacterized protein n=1 Tax=Trichinella pseudospiralis TaxID=6337 RepID=A0A0V0XEI6_TRIPS|nr:hypothetical protein T4E_6526 [Trichinella pseudospiralis]